MRSFEKSTLHSIVDKEAPRQKIVTEYEQPALSRLYGFVVWRLDKLTYSTKPVRKVWLWGEKTLDSIAQRRHDTTCNNDCGTWYVRLDSDPATGMFEMDEEHARPGCTRMYLGARWDLWIYHQTERNKKFIAMYNERP